MTYNVFSGTLNTTQSINQAVRFNEYVGESHTGVVLQFTSAVTNTSEDEDNAYLFI